VLTLSIHHKCSESTVECRVGFFRVGAFRRTGIRGVRGDASIAVDVVSLERLDLHQPPIRRARSLRNYLAFKPGGARNRQETNVLLPRWRLEELTFAPSKESPWEAFFRIHHRFGVFGLINGVDGGSNSVTVGWRSQL
jgi:hypothetical protein